MKSERRFAPPWSVEESPACFIISDVYCRALSLVMRMSRGDDEEEKEGENHAADCLCIHSCDADLRG